MTSHQSWGLSEKVFRNGGDEEVCSDDAPPKLQSRFVLLLFGTKAAVFKSCNG